MNILVITGRLAEKNIKRYVENSDHKVDVLKLPVTVAAFISPEYAASKLESKSLEKYDMILLPGTIQGDVSIIEEKTGIQTYKGTKHASELEILLQELEGLKLSKVDPANEVLSKQLLEKALDEISEAEDHWRENLKIKGGILIGDDLNGVAIGPGFPIRIIAEIVNAPLRNLDEIAEEAIYYEEEGADIIDIGMLAEKQAPEQIPEIIDTIKTNVDLPVSIDSLNPREIISAIEADIDLVLSLDSGNLEAVAPRLEDIPVVILPSNMSVGDLPKKAELRVQRLIENIQKAREFGVENVIADTVLDPPINPGIMESLKAYQLFKEAEPSIPLLFGLGNVTELLDVDSPGVNGLLTAIASEIGAELVHVPEYSVKAKGSVREVSTASKMMFLAKKRETIPKDLGLDLLILKEKTWKEDQVHVENFTGIDHIEARNDFEFNPDREGWFKIRVDREENLIRVLHFPLNKKTPDKLIYGTNASDIYKTIIDETLVGSLDHAAYMGKELQKAEIALRLGRSYNQDEGIFEKSMNSQ